MADLPAYSVSEHDPNSPALVRAMNSSSSAKLSIRSSRSRITLVDHGASLEPKIDVLDGTISDVKGWSRFDHLLAVFCINRRPKSAAIVPERRADQEHHETRLDRSPWVLPVYVLSRERDEYRHLIPREAKCTIDTGNLQGNIVSRAFLVDVLGYSEADFCQLTKDEEDGGMGITGHTLIPKGAIHLTWYHANSIRVFREMRFLISEHPMYDLIIGARAIRTYNILDVPNLMTGGIVDLTMAPMTDELRKLEEEKNILFQKRDAFQIKERKEKKKNGSVTSATAEEQHKIRTEFDSTKQKFEEKLEVYCRDQIKDAKARGEAKLKGKKQELPKEIQKEIQDLQNLFKAKTDPQRDLFPKEKDE